MAPSSPSPARRKPYAINSYLDLDANTGTDKFLREAMFGPEHPLKQGRDGLPNGKASVDPNLPGFGPFGTVGRHCFDSKSPAYTRIAALLDVRKRFPVLRTGRQYQREDIELRRGLRPAARGRAHRLVAHPR